MVYMILGAHLSIAKGFNKAALEALKINANTFQFFTRNPRGGKAKDLNPKDIEQLREIMKEHNFGQLLAHAPYMINMAASNPDVYYFAKIAFKSDLERLENLPCELYNFHPGSHVGKGIELGIEKIVAILNETLTGEESTSSL
jgi:deoxyribonuclease-4